MPREEHSQEQCPGSRQEGPRSRRNDQGLETLSLEFWSFFDEECLCFARPSWQRHVEELVTLSRSSVHLLLGSRQEGPRSRRNDQGLEALSLEFWSFFDGECLCLARPSWQRHVEELVTLSRSSVHLLLGEGGLPREQEQEGVLLFRILVVL